MEPQLFQFPVDDQVDKLIEITRLGRRTLVKVKFVQGGVVVLQQTHQLASVMPPTIRANSLGLTLSYDVGFAGIRLWKVARRY